MILWDYFFLFAILALLLWTAGAYASWKSRTRLAVTYTSLGLVVFFSFILGIWWVMERPPLRTMGETRLWYSFFLPLVGLIVYGRWRYKWILSFSTLMATVFICINIFKPEIHSKALMPALQSPWFAPHVIVYMFAYATLGASTLMALYYLIKPKRWQDDGGLDELVHVGLAFLTFGMLFGSLWAKEAWGHYWSWDPKETWAAITWLAYLIYIHYRRIPHHNPRLALWILLFAFVLLQMCWWGINYLPSAKGASIHVYGS